MGIAYDQRLRKRTAPPEPDPPCTLQVGGERTQKLLKMKWPRAVLVYGPWHVRMFGPGVPQFMPTGRYPNGLSQFKGQTAEQYIFDVAHVGQQDLAAMVAWLDARRALYEFSREPAEVLAMKARQHE